MTMTSGRLAQSFAFLLIACCAATGRAVGQTAADGPISDRVSVNSADDDARDLVFLAADTPLFVRIHLQIDGKGFRARWAEYAGKLFTRLDADGDGFLDRAEAEKLPTDLAGSPIEMSAPLRWSTMDANPRDGKITPEEFRRFVVRLLDRSLSIGVRTSRPTQSVGLFGQLDRDRDGQLSFEEITAGYQTVRMVDIDANEVIGVDELLPPQNPFGGFVDRPASAETADLPFIELRPDEQAVKQAVDVLLARYGGSRESERPSEPRGLDRDSLAVDAGTFARFDGDGNGLLSADELPRLLNDPPPRVRFLVQLKVRQYGRPKITLVTDKDAAITDVRQEATSALELTLAGIGLELRASRPRTTTFDAAQFFKLRFRVADADKNQYLDQEEFPNLSLPGVSFDEVDANGDGQIFRDEADAYVERAGDAAESQLSLTVSREGRSLFEVIDANSDRRLSLREFREAAQRLAEYDANSDQRLSEVEFAYRYRLSVRSGESPLLTAQDAVAPVSPVNRPTPIVRDPAAGPTWFQRMDRNRDGDVSQREFLGSLELFGRMDRNGDGWIDAAEAADYEENR